MILVCLSKRGIELHNTPEVRTVNDPVILTLGYADKHPVAEVPLEFSNWGLLTQVLCCAEKVEVLTDHAGAYPLYFARAADSIWIGSSAWEVVARAQLQAMNYAACMEMLAYEFVIGPHTLVEGLEELRPGILTTFSFESGTWQRSEQIRWQLEYTGDSKLTLKDRTRLGAEIMHAACAPVVERAQDATSPLALNLSGGWDSRAVLACLLPLGPQHLFTSTYGDETYSGVKIARAASASVGIPHRFFPFSSGQMLREWFIELCRALPPVIRFNLADGGYAMSRQLYGATCGVSCGHSGDFFTGAPFYPADKVKNADQLCAWLKRSMRSAFPRDQLLRILHPKHRDLADAPEDHLSQTANEVFAPGYTGVLRWKLEHRVRRAAVVELRVLEQRTPIVYAPLLHRDFIAFWGTVPPGDLVGQSLYKRILAEQLFTGAARPLAELPREGGGSVREFGPLSKWKGFTRKKIAGLKRRVAPAAAAQASAADPTARWWRGDPELRQWAWQTLQHSPLIAELFDLARLKTLILEQSMSDFPLARIGVWNMLTLAGVEQVLRELQSLTRAPRD
ncbi:MAG: asparagine synthase-related protein [Candidatus Sumerlaeaceae bacterium]